MCHALAERCVLPTRAQRRAVRSNRTCTAISQSRRVQNALSPFLLSFICICYNGVFVVCCHAVWLHAGGAVSGGSLPPTESQQLPRVGAAAAPAAPAASRRATRASGRSMLPSAGSTQQSHSDDEDEDGNGDGDEHEDEGDGDDGREMEGSPQQAHDKEDEDGDEHGEDGDQEEGGDGDDDQEDDGDEDGDELGDVPQFAAPLPSQSTQASEPPPRAAMTRRRRL